MTWFEAQEKVRKHVFKIETPDGYGTGFLFAYSEARFAIGIATAAHVLASANKWQQPIRLTHAESGHELLLNDSDRVIFPDVARDTAALLIYQKEDRFVELAKKLPPNTLELVAADQIIRIGVPVGWLGYPAITDETLCFFRGHVSAFQHGVDAYLIDGVSIHGLSGGPVFTDSPEPRLLGSISAYLANRTAGTTLPGLIRAYDLTALHATIATLRNVDEARAKAAAAAKQAEANQAAQAAGDPAPSNAASDSVSPDGIKEGIPRRGPGARKA